MTGSINLDLDIFALIPQEGYVFAEDGEVEYQGVGDQRPMEIYQWPDGNVYAAGLREDEPQRIVPAFIKGGVPPGVGVMVLCAQRSAVSTKGDEVYAQVKHYPRWDFLAGAET